MATIVRKSVRGWWSTLAGPERGAASRSGASGAVAGPPGLEHLASHYAECVKAFYEYLPAQVKEVFVADALYHRTRYLDLLSQSYGDEVVELGSDKPFVTHHLRALHPQSHFHTISIDIPYSPYPIIRIDIESEAFPLTTAPSATSSSRRSWSIFSAIPPGPSFRSTGL